MSATERQPIREPFRLADLRDLNRAIDAMDRIQARHGEAYDDYDFDPINAARAALIEAVESVVVDV